MKEKVKRAEPDIVDLCSKLVKFPTVNPPGDTEKCVDFVKSYFDEVGIKTSIYKRAEGKSNICASIPGKSNAKVLWLGHLDVIHEGSRAKWSHDPYGGEIVDGRIYGRGSTDMKGSCAAAMVAAKIISTIGTDHCNAEFWFTCDEEVDGEDGVSWLAKTGKFHGDVCIIGDSSGACPTSPAIDLGCKGQLWTTIRAEGKTAHGSVPFMGDNAIDKIIQALQHLKRIEDLRLNIPKELDSVIESTIRLYLKGPTTLNETQKTALNKLFRHPSISVNLIKGGVEVNMVPDLAEATLDIRISPGTDLGDVSKKILRLLEDAGIEGLKAEFNPSMGYYESPTSEFAVQLMDIVKRMTGAEPALKLLIGATDGRFVKRILGIPCLGFGAGIGGMPHAPEEYVTIENLLMAANVYTIFPCVYRSQKRERLSDG